MAFAGTSMIAGWISDIVNGIATIAYLMINPTALWNYLITSIQFFVGYILYGLQIGLFWIIDCIQSLFRKIAGLDTYYINGTETEGDMVISFLQDPTVTSVFVAMLVAAAFMLIIATFIAVLKSETDEKNNAKGPIFKSAIKAIIYFAMVPVACFLGVIVSNIVLRTLDGASSQGATSMSNQVFCSAAYNANRARINKDFARTVWETGIVPGLPTNFDQALVARAIDDAFRTTAESKGTGNIQLNPTVVDHMQSYAFGNLVLHIDKFNISNYTAIYYFYDIFAYNYLIGYLGGFTVAMMLLVLILGVIKRLFELTILFVVSPPIIALMPLDNGSRYNTWKGAFIQRVFAAYGPIVGLNLVFMVLTVLQTVTLYEPGVGLNDLFNSLVQLLFVITALVSVKELVNLVTQMVGQGDSLASGESSKDPVKQLGGKMANMAYAAPGAVAKAGYNAVNTGRDINQARKYAKGNGIGLRAAYNAIEAGDVDGLSSNKRMKNSEASSIAKNIGLLDRYNKAAESGFAPAIGKGLLEQRQKEKEEAKAKKDKRKAMEEEYKMRQEIEGDRASRGGDAANDNVSNTSSDTTTTSAKNNTPTNVNGGHAIINGGANFSIKGNPIIHTTTANMDTTPQISDEDLAEALQYHFDSEPKPEYNPEKEFSQLAGAYAQSVEADNLAEALQFHFATDPSVLRDENPASEFSSLAKAVAQEAADQQSENDMKQLLATMSQSVSEEKTEDEMKQLLATMSQSVSQEKAAADQAKAMARLLEQQNMVSRRIDATLQKIQQEREQMKAEKRKNK